MGSSQVSGKRFPPGSQILTDYLQLKLVENLRNEETWRSCLVRFIKVLNNESDLV